MFKIGFHASDTENPTVKQGKILTRPAAEPRKSVVLIHFPARNMTLPYYNDGSCSTHLESEQVYDLPTSRA